MLCLAESHARLVGRKLCLWRACIQMQRKAAQRLPQLGTPGADDRKVLEFKVQGSKFSIEFSGDLD